MKKQTYYPAYDVMAHQDHWDEHTKTIVENRLIREHGYRYINLVEAEILRAWCSLLMDDSRGEIIQYILSHIDESLFMNKGEGQRKSGTPEARVLIREGLKAIESSALTLDSKPFFQLKDAQQKQIMISISEGNLADTELWEGIPQQELFQKLLTLSVEAYYSHPTIWSEIGYGGPAYPRGYVRAHLGQLDPWEAVKQP
jgi:hypothetical protein